MSVSDPMVTPPSQPRGSKTTLLAAVLVLIAFLGGIVAGIAGDRFYLFRHHEFFPHRAGPFVTEHLVRRLERELSLTPQQRDEVRRILESRRGRIEAIFANVRPQVTQEIDQANAEIEKILTPEQRSKFDAIKIRMQRHRDRGPGGPPPPQ